MLNRDHFDPFELDEVLRGRQKDIVATYHLNTCRSCREALLDLTLMAGLARGAPFDDPFESGAPGDDGDTTGLGSPVNRSSTLDVESVFAQFAMLQDSTRASVQPPTGELHYSEMDEKPYHLVEADMDALLAAAFAADAPDPRFLDHLRHLRECGTCLGRFLRVSGRDMPSPRLVKGIVRALQPQAKPTRKPDPKRS